MKLAIVSDIHGNLPALEAVIRDIDARGVDTVINLGDSLSGPLMPRETAEYLMGQNWFHLAGNHERQILSHGPERRGQSDEYAHSQLMPHQFEWIATLKPCAQFSPEVFLCHGTPTSDLIYFLETVEPGGVRLANVAEVAERLGHVDAELIVCGHSHVPRSVRASTGQLIVNPGSVGLQAVVGDPQPYPHVLENGSPDARYAIVQRRHGEWTASLISVAYEFAPMANLAATRQRPEWAVALRTGYVK